MRGSSSPRPAEGSMWARPAGQQPGGNKTSPQILTFVSLLIMGEKKKRPVVFATDLQALGETRNSIMENMSVWL